MSNQVTTTIAIDLENRNRATVFWRGFLVIPVFIFVASLPRAPLPMNRR